MKKVCLVMMAALLLGGCGMRKEDLGMARAKPDESQVSVRERLVIPPEYGVRPAVVQQDRESDDDGSEAFE